jgi:hypothetical protein
MMPSPLLYNIVSIASEVSYAALFSSIPWPFLIRLAVPLASLIWSFTHSFIYSPTSDRSLTLSSRAHATRARTPHSLIQLHRCAAAAAILGPHTHFELPYHLFFFFFFFFLLFLFWQSFPLYCPYYRYIVFLKKAQAGLSWSITGYDSTRLPPSTALDSLLPSTTPPIRLLFIQSNRTSVAPPQETSLSLTTTLFFSLLLLSFALISWTSPHSFAPPAYTDTRATQTHAHPTSRGSNYLFWPERRKKKRKSHIEPAGQLALV